KAKFDVTLDQRFVPNPLKKEVITAFQEEVIVDPEPENFSYANIMHIISALEEYRYNLEHLDRLRVSYFKYHNTDPDIDIIEEDFDL
ncbi:aromatic acid exporter family protein, partial [Staphylococcus pseudintermedius]|nr:aromatic acid exporter family protein [Staphylococcus pseudintermedius]